jgi:two-component system OmpR family response regulator
VRLLLVEDQPALVKALRQGLEEEGFAVDTAMDGEDADVKARTTQYDVIVLDVMLPKKDGLTLLKGWRQSGILTHVLMLTARTTLDDKVVGLDMGADDYLTKPFNPRELLARVRAVLRRAQSLPAQRATLLGDKVSFDGKTLDIGRREVTGADGVAVPLSTAEFRLLCVFLEHPGMVLTRDQLLDLTAGRAADAWDRSVDNQVSRLRRKIEADPKNPVLIKTHWGGGYCFTGKVETA